jgi:type IV pilus assembly protein PilY1
VGFKTADYDLEAKDGSTYRSPMGAVCQPNFIIFIGTGGPDSSEDGDAKLLLNGLGGVLNTDPLKFAPDNYISNWLDEYARTLNKADLSDALSGQQKVTTYTIAVQTPSDNTFNNQGNQSARKLLESAAIQGGGEYALGQDGQTTLKAIVSALRKMQPVNSVFAAVTLPVSVNVRGTFLNQVYMGQFRPDRNARPRWPGNLKQYQIGLNGNNEPILTDRNNAPVEDTAKGFLLPDITSFWSRTSGFWSFTTMEASDAPDGAVVEKGGAAQRMRAALATAQGRTSRSLYTCNGNCVAGAALSSVLFDNANANITDVKLGVNGGGARTDLIEWVRGADNYEDENVNGLKTDGRAYIHGDLLHSRPAVVNYNRSAGNRDIVVFYGANDGVFHAVKGGQDDADGFEKWGMIFPEFLDRLKVIRDNNTVIGVNTSKPYFADGPVSVYQKDANGDGRIVAGDGDKVWLFIGMRRGGNFLYALDVSDPDVPKFMWKIDTDKLVNNARPFAGLGQTWSTARPALMKTNGGRPVVIFGGGYDPTNEDPNPALAGNAMGKGIYVVDAENGTFIRQLTHADMGAIPGDVTLLDSDADGKIDRIYAGDTKGNVWRIDADDATAANWTIHKLAALGGSGADGRKFLNKIDVVPGGTFDAVLVGSGDREHPFLTNIVDRFYMIKDTNRGLTGGLVCGGNTPATCTHADLTDVTSYAPTQQVPAASKGWYLTLGTGEKMVGSPVTVFGTVIFGTNKPKQDDNANTCGNLGEARVYQISFENGGAVADLNSDGIINAADRAETLAGGGFPPAAVWSRVRPTDRNGNPTNKTTDVVCVGTHCFKPGGYSFDTRRYRTYWYKK